MPSIWRRTPTACIKPDGLPSGRSLCVASPVTTALESNPRRVRKHFHLRYRRILRFVQNHKGAVQRPPAHKRQRRNFNDAPLNILRDDVDGKHIVKGVVKRAQIRVDLCLDVAGQKAQFLAGFPRRGASS